MHMVKWFEVRLYMITWMEWNQKKHILKYRCKNSIQREIRVIATYHRTGISTPVVTDNCCIKIALHCVIETRPKHVSRSFQLNNICTWMIGLIIWHRDCQNDFKLTIYPQKHTSWATHFFYGEPLLCPCLRKKCYFSVCLSKHSVTKLLLG